MSRAKRASRWAAAALAATLSLPASAPAWESTTTHAGLTEQAALGSELHRRIKAQFGFDAGLLAPLTVPPEDAPALFRVLRLVSPSHGYVPDARGRLDALGWLVIGSVVADTPASHAANHFFDPATRRGLGADTLRGLAQSLRHRFLPALFGEEVERDGVPAPEWLVSEANPMGYQGFADQYRKAVSARTDNERRRHLAGALLAAGAMLHVLQDMGSPSHVRNDIAAHLDRTGPSPDDRSSRFERLAALAYDRLGVPAPADPPSPRPLQAYLSASDGSGLADRTAARYFSAYTMPRSTEIEVGAGSAEVARSLAGALRRQQPRPERLDLLAARGDDGATFADDRGVCLARYRLRRGTLSWYQDDRCAIEQIGALLPEIGGYGVGFLDTLFRGTLNLEVTGTGLALDTGDLALGKGRLTAYWDDADGNRTQYATIDLAAGAAPRLPAPPADATAVAVLFDGSDAAGEPLLAAGTLALR